MKGAPSGAAPLIADEAPQSDLETAARGLKEHLATGRLEAALDAIVRMLSRGDDPSRVALEIAAFDALHNEQGCGRPLICAADALRHEGAFCGAHAGLPLAHAASVAIDTSKYRAPRRVPPSKDPGREPEGVARKLLVACRDGDPDAADGLMRGALWRKWPRETIEPWLFELNAHHFFGGGDGLVLCVKALRLLRRVGFEHARRILPGLCFALAAMKRDDEHSEWQWFRQRYAQLEPRLDALWARQGKRPLDEQEWAHVTRSSLDGSREEAWHAVIGVLAAGASVSSLIDTLARAACERMWRFDHARDLAGSLEASWLDVTRPVLYWHALHEVAPAFQKPQLLRMVLFGVHVVHRAETRDLAPDQWLVVDAKGRGSMADLERVLESVSDGIRARDPVEAQRAAMMWIGAGGPIETLRDALLAVVMNDLYARPVYAAHGCQVVTAAFELAQALPEGSRAWPLRAVIRMLATPLREARVAAMFERAQSRATPNRTSE